jgi:hypothetical protein
LRKFYGAQQWDSPEMLAYFDSILGKSGGGGAQSSLLH